MIETVAAQIVSTIVPYLIKAGKVAVEGVAAKAIDVIRKKFKGDDYAEQTLKRLEDKPEDEGRASAMRIMLAEKMRSDRKFASILEQIAKQIDQPAGDVINQNITLDRGSKVTGNIIQTGKQEIKRERKRAS